MAVEPPLALEQLPDGVYLGLKEDIYFAQDRLGSSDLIKLYKFKEGWYWQSRHNPDRGGQTDAQNYGSALHAIMLEGMAAYEGRFRVEPDPKDYKPKKLLTTNKAIKAQLEEEGVDTRKTSSFLTDDWLDAAAVHLPDWTCWEAVKRDFAKACLKPDGKTTYPTVSAVEDRMLRFMREVAMDDPDIQGILGFDQETPVLAEVSVFWTDRHGLKRRARFDKPCPQFTADLKSVGNWQGRELKHALGDRVVFECYDLQMADQHVARQHMNAWLAESDAKLSGGTDEERAWLQAIARRSKRWHWWWLFYQKPEPTGRAPILFPLAARWGGAFHRSGFRKSVLAIDVYLRGVERFGLGEIPNAFGGPAKPWSRVEAPHYEPDTPGIPADAPTITLPFKGWEEEPVEGEEEALA
jgi:hypothetical protein